MSDFLMIIPAGWVEVPEIAELVNAGATPVSEISYQLEQSAWDYVDALLVSAALPTDGKLVANARLIYTDAGYKFWVLFA